MKLLTSLNASERCAALMFAVLGVGLASWAPRIPDIKGRLGISDAELGGALLAVAAGSMILMPLTGLLINRFGSNRVLGLSGAAFSLALILPALAPNLWWLIAALAVLGASIGSLDVSMNAQAAALERARGSQIMGICHGMYSIGAIAGAIIGGIAAQSGLSASLHLGVLGVTLAAVSLLLVNGVAETADPPHHQKTDEPAPGALVLPSPALLGLGLVAFCALMAEGAMLDWSAVYLREHVSATPFLAGAGFAVFSIGMAAGRLVCDRIAETRGRLFVIRTGAIVSALSLGTALAQDNAVLTVAWFGLFGIGLSGMLPVLFSVAGQGKTGMAPGPAIAALATMGYTGLLIGPVVIGFASAFMSLPTALMLLLVAMLAVALFAGRLPLGADDERRPAGADEPERRASISPNETAAGKRPRQFDPT